MELLDHTPYGDGVRGESLGGKWPERDRRVEASQ